MRIDKSGDHHIFQFICEEDGSRILGAVDATITKTNTIMNFFIA